MNNQFLIILMASVLISCSGKKKEIKVAQDEVKKLLIDPESARFRNTYIAILGICGEVNARNSFGGYTGFKKFHYSSASTDAGKKSSVIIENEHNLSTINIVCEKPN